MKTSPEVERWFADKKAPTESTIRRVREIILRADRRTHGFQEISHTWRGRGRARASLTPAKKGSTK